MLLLSLFVLALTTIAGYLTIKSNQEIIKVSMACIAIIGLIVTVLSAPWLIKIVVVSIPVFFEVFSWLSAENI